MFFNLTLQNLNLSIPSHIKLSNSQHITPSNLHSPQASGKDILVQTFFDIYLTFPPIDPVALHRAGHSALYKRGTLTGYKTLTSWTFSGLSSKFSDDQVRFRNFLSDIASQKI